ncbi:MAG: DNA mismatch endonuclease Vsr [Ignavibacteriae bacterium]|nr:DNA mismatch endonuclease Vsr [Ignavibacteriota bacterium]
MTDVHTVATRSYNMSRIKSKNTKPEILVRQFLRSQGIRFGVNHNKLPGKPDLALRKQQTAIFVNGCFWHGHTGCKYFVIPKTRTNWWITKISGNKFNDRAKRRKLRKLGWKVIIIWECELRFRKKEKTLSRLLSELK